MTQTHTLMTEDFNHDNVQLNFIQLRQGKSHDQYCAIEGSSDSEIALGNSVVFSIPLRN